MSLITEPTKEPVTLQEAKRQCYVEHDDDDLLIERLISAARQHVEDLTNSSLVRQKHRQYLDGFSEARLCNGPVQSIDQVQYVDADGVTQTLATSVYELNLAAPQILLQYGQTWPSTRYQKNSVWIDYWAGYFDPADSPINLTAKVPEPLKHGILMLVTDMYENRQIESDIQTYKNKAFDYLVGPYRRFLQ